MSGKVFLGDKRIDKSGTVVNIESKLSIKENDNPWVSRGGLKLEYAIKNFKINLNELIGLDIGASTGGFTDVLLYYRAKKVYSLDVGYGQIAWKLRIDDRVKAIERVNARYLESSFFDEEIDIVVCDASFISLKKVLSSTLSFVKPGCKLVALIKPQFEAGKSNIDKGGVVNKKEIHDQVCQDVRNWLISISWKVLGLVESPLIGPAGNKEFFIYSEKL